jgi:hypothetical protein
VATGLSAKSPLTLTIDLAAIAADDSLCGVAIINVIRYVSLQALGNDRCEISAADLAESIRRQQSDSSEKPFRIGHHDSDIFS